MRNYFEYCGISFYDFENISVAQLQWTFSHGADLIELESLFLIEPTVIPKEKFLEFEITLEA